MSESVFLSGIPGAIPDAREEPGRAITPAPGLNGTVRHCQTGRAGDLDHHALRDLVLLQNTAIISDAGGTVVLSPSGPDGTVHRPALAAAARGLTRSRFDPMPSV